MRSRWLSYHTMPGIVGRREDEDEDEDDGFLRLLRLPSSSSRRPAVDEGWDITFSSNAQSGIEGPWSTKLVFFVMNGVGSFFFRLLMMGDLLEGIL